MSGQPRFEQIKLVVADVAASLAFYEMLGLTFEVRGAHAWAHLGDGLVFEVDAAGLAASWRGRTARPGDNTVIGFRVDDAASVDRLYDRLTAAGYQGELAPHRAPWGRRLAIVADPDGNPVAISAPQSAGTAVSAPRA